jgi:hypothetical protein
MYVRNAVGEDHLLQLQDAPLLTDFGSKDGWPGVHIPHHTLHALESYEMLLCDFITSLHGTDTRRRTSKAELTRMIGSRMQYTIANA